MKIIFRVLLVVMLIVPAMCQLPSQDILALLEFKMGIKHDPTGFVFDSWNEESIDLNGCPSSWNGILCINGSISDVVLDNLSLSANIDLGVFSNLTKLVKLSMSNNSISGKFPRNLGDFKRLEFLDISDNLFFSFLPPEFGVVKSLKDLSLAGNNFSGYIPDSISGFTSLRSLDFSRNSFSGIIPSSLTKLTNLVYLNLSANGFTKKIPRGFRYMANLEVLDFHGNMLEGRLDAELLLLTTATHVDFSGNSITSTRHGQKLLSEISDTIKYLNLSHNRLTGSLVNGGKAQMFGSLVVLDLSHNQFSGELPGFNFIYDLQVLILSNNQFSGFIPNNLLKGDSLVLTVLDLSCNNLTGSISMITSTSLQILNLSSNGLSGELPLLTGSCTVLDLSKNKFEGNLTRLVKWGNIQFLDLSQNRITGSIPEPMPQFLHISYLNLSHNSLNSSIPRVITQFPRLTVLDLGFNQLDGLFPTALMSLLTLQELHLQNNKLVGNLLFPSSYSNESKIRVLDLSHNLFSGNFPGGFGFLTRLQVLSLAGNSFSGSLPFSKGEITSLVSLDISGNHFVGQLSKNLPDTLQSFNASYNDLSGVVPKNLRKFPRSSFFPGNSGLEFSNPLPEQNSGGPSSKKKPIKTIVKVLVIVSCVFALVILVFLAIFIHYMHISNQPLTQEVTSKEVHHHQTIIHNPSSGSGMAISGGDIVTKRIGSSSSEMISTEKTGCALTSFSPSKNSRFSYSPDSRDSNLSRLDLRSPDRLGGELYFLDDTILFLAEELSRAPAEVLGRSSHGTSYKTTLDNGLLLTVKWLREGIAKQQKDFAKEVKKFANIRHPNVVGLRGYYWGPTQHEKLILSDYISPGSLASFLYDRPGRQGSPLTWAQRLKIAVDIARGLNYLHFDRVVPHGNLKSTNILLDCADLNARVADYCLHRLMTQAGTIEQIFDAGVRGYRAPELATSKRPLPSFKADVYAFGVILLELLTGKCAGDVVSDEDGRRVGLTDWVRLRIAKGHWLDCFDVVLIPEMGTERGMHEVLGIALRCIQPLPERPGIKSVYEDLSSI
ncbi:probable LRR receptor-like serine/threonine-protein kinase At4g20940 [Cynara cardunculus var. scolymus]|uniref:probable LRR receptor-like serine/threonine-protein kinase At4g20940 n=1 Tax=Cynara cardunculus var. scolymus TaxID=59895 RepID=UPI000D626BD7|nr:probable LRR receptor-like serine/threonine-protein kinase At4g20940 [Cynara cardunculus var. scolymus]